MTPQPSVRRTAFALAPAVLLAGFAGGIAFPILPIVGERQGLRLAFIGGLGLALIGLGTGALGPSLLALLSNWVPAERRGVGVGALQLCGDAGGALGPLVGTVLLAGSVRAPYLVTAALVACLVPVGGWLTGRQREQLA